MLLFYFFRGCGFFLVSVGSVDGPGAATSIGGYSGSAKRSSSSICSFRIFCEAVTALESEAMLNIL